MWSSDSIPSDVFMACCLRTRIGLDSFYTFNVVARGHVPLFSFSTTFRDPLRCQMLTSFVFLSRIPTEFFHIGLPDLSIIRKPK
jgi:hypothetical protein